MDIKELKGYQQAFAYRTAVSYMERVLIIQIIRN